MALHPTSRIARIMDSLGDAAVASARQAVVVIGSLIVAMAVFGDHTLAGFDFVLSRIDGYAAVLPPSPPISPSPSRPLSSLSFAENQLTAEARLVRVVAIMVQHSVFL